MTRAIAAAALAVAALPASAPAATWSAPLAPCFVSATPAARELVPLRAEGFAPYSRIVVLVDGAEADADGDGVADEVYADAAGRVDGKGVPAPYQQQGERPFTISLTEQANPSSTVAVTTKVTAVAVRLKPSQAAPSAKVRFLGRGFTRRAGVWGHYVYRGKVRRTVRLAVRPHGACGTFSARRRQIPIVRPRTGQWILQVDQQRTYSAQPRNSVVSRVPITVQRVIAPAR
jgi:hypothetical protein